MECISYVLKRLVIKYKLLEKLLDKRSKVKYLISFRKRNQTRFYD